MKYQTALTFSVEHHTGALALLAVTGEIDFETAPALRSRALNLIDQGQTRLIVDLSAVSFCDSSGLNVLINIVRCVQQSNGSLALAAVPGDLTRILDITGIGQLMPSYSSAAEALAAHEMPAGAAPDPA